MLAGWFSSHITFSPPLSLEGVHLHLYHNAPACSIPFTVRYIKMLHYVLKECHKNAATSGIM